MILVALVWVFTAGALASVFAWPLLPLEWRAQILEGLNAYYEEREP